MGQKIFLYVVISRKHKLQGKTVQMELIYEYIWKLHLFKES